MVRRANWNCLLAVTLLLAASLVAQAQTVQDEIQVTRASIQADRQKVVAAAMDLTDAESTAFWPVYRDYRGEIEKQNDILDSVAQEFLTKYDALTDDEATALLTKWLDAETARRQIQRKYVKRFMKAIPAKKTARFFQIENKLDAIVKFELAGAIPLAK